MGMRVLRDVWVKWGFDVWMGCVSYLLFPFLYLCYNPLLVVSYSNPFCVFSYLQLP